MNKSSVTTPPKGEGLLRRKSYSRMKAITASVDDMSFDKQTRISRTSLKKRPSRFSFISPELMVHCSCERLQKELYEFIDDFIASQEYQDYVKFKASILKKDQETQFDIADLKVIEKEESVKSEETIDLSRKALRVFNLEKQIEKYASNLKNAEILDKQQEAIKLIRQKIAEVKKVFLCHKKEKEELKNEKKQAVIQRFIRMHNIDVSRMLSTKRLDKVILGIEKKLRMQRKTHKNNIKSIVEKLLREYKAKRSIQRKKMKQRRLERIEKGGILHLKGRANSLDIISSVHMPPRPRDNKFIEELKEAGVCLKEDKPIKKMPTMTRNSSEEFQRSSEVLLEEEVSQEDNFEFFNEDGKYRIYLDDSAHRKLGILQSFVEFENTLEARHFLCICEKLRKEKEMMLIDYPDDTAFIIKPNEIIFQNFLKGKIYKKQIVLINLSGYGQKIRLLKIYTEDPTQVIYFELETDEMKVAPPGLPIKYTLIFKPTETTNITKRMMGCLVFLICNKSQYYRRIIPMDCVPKVFDVTIEPLHLSFGTIPIWRFQKKTEDFYKNVKVKYSGHSSYKVIMKKMKDPFDLITVSWEEEYDDFITNVQQEPINQAELDVEAILNDIIQEVESDFRIDKRFLAINEYSGEQTIEVSLSGDKYPGFFIEKYQFDIYEVKETNDDYKGMQEITLILEVSDYPIKCDPIFVDFGICFFDVAYQAKFNLTNFSSITQPVSLKIPSTLTYYVSMDEKTAYIRSEESREIAVKFLPSSDLQTDNNKYYDPRTDILCFPIQIKLLNKQYSDAPPLTQQAFAILCNCADLKLAPRFKRHYRQIDDHMVLDMGDCFVNETVVTHVTLKNPCCCTIFYCFKNLPRFMTIMPNYGVGAIEACQEIDLKLFVHPTLDDFEALGMDAHVFSQIKHFKISVTTMNKVGKYRKKPDQNRLAKLLRLMLKELRKVEDTSMLEDICIARCIWRLRMVPCSCESALKKRRDEEEMEAYQSMLRELTNFSSSGTQQAFLNTATSGKFDANGDNFSDSSSRGSIAIKPQEKTKSNNQAGKKKKRKLLKRKTQESSNTLTSIQFDEDIADKAENTDVRPFSTEDRLLIPTNSEANFDENLTSYLFIKTNFIKPLYEFSFNHIEFPATPGASFSTMMIELRPLKFFDKSCCCGFEPVPQKPKYRAFFRIAGSTEEMRIEPTYGTLEYEESRLITLIATPKINDDVVAGYAFDRKRSALLREKIMEAEQKRKEEEMARRKSKKKSKTKDKPKRKRSRSSEIKLVKSDEEQPVEEEVLPTVLSEEVQIGVLDFYPAEIAIWRNIEPYFLNVNFVCHVEYDTEDFWYHPPDVFSLETVCKVIAPDFIHDQKSQQLDFGQIAIGETRRKIITIQNIKYNDITVRTSILRPHGSFVCPNFDPVVLPSECFLKIPITYRATHEEKALEYMEIKAERTNYQFILSAEGIPSSIQVEPTFKVFRLLSKKGKTAELSFEAKNDSSFPVTIKLEKVCELKGRIISVPPLESDEEKEIKPKVKAKKGKKDKPKSQRSTPRDKAKEMQHSDELTENEYYSIENNFEKNSGLPYFDSDKEDSGKINLMEHSISTFKIFFGQPEQLQSRRLPTKQKSDKKNRKRSGKKIPFPTEFIGKTIIAKYNILIGSSQFLRDFILVGEFTQ